MADRNKAVELHYNKATEISAAKKKEFDLWFQNQLIMTSYH